MHGMKEIIQEAASLPIIEKKWIKVAKKRLTELKSGSVKAISGDKVFSRIQQRFEK